MAGNSLALAWDLIARDNASPTFLRVSAAADKAAASTEAAAAKTEAASTRMGAAVKKMALGATVGLAAFGVESVKMAADFQKSMLLVQTQAGASAAEVKKMTPAILSLAGQVAQAPEQLATSLYHVESTGLRGAKALDAVKIAAEGARVGHADLEQTTNALTATIASGMLPATESYAQAMGQLNTIVGSGDMKMSDLNDALSTGLLVTVKQYGVTMNDVGAALADFGDNNLRGADAATRLRMAVQAIAAPSVKAAGVLKTIGLSVQQLQSDEETGGLNKALTDLHTHLVNSGIDASKWGTLLTEAFTKKAGSGVLTLIGTFDRFEQKFHDMQKGTDSFGAQWAATTKSASFQAAALGRSIEGLTISVGDKLMPVVTSGLSWINHTGVPALEHMGSAAADAAHWFSELPTPIKDTALALGALGLSKMVGLTGALSGAAGRLAVPLQAVGNALYFAEPHAGRFSAEMEVQQKLFQMEQREAQLAAAGISELDGAFASAAVAADGASASLTSVQRSLRGWDAALAETIVVEDTQVAALGRMSAATAAAGVTMGRTAAGGMAKLGKAGSGLLALFGGPWGAALIGAAAGIYGINKAFEMERQRVEDATKAILGWKKAQDTGGQGAVEATQKLDAYQKKIDDAQKALRESEKAEQGAQGSTEGYAQGVAIASNNLGDLKKALADANAQYQKYKDGLTVLQIAQVAAKKAQSNLNDAYEKYGANSPQVRAAAAQYADAEQNVAVAQQNSNNATKTALQLLQDKANAELGAINSALGAQQAQLSFNDALTQYNKDASDGQHTSAQLAQEQNSLAQSAISAAQAAGQQAADQAKANGVTDTANISNQAMLTTLQGVAKQMGANTPAAIRQAIAALSSATVKSDSLKDAISKMGLTTATESSRFRKEFGNNAVVLKGVTDSQVKDLQGLGYTVEHLPNHQVVVSADTQKARDALTQLTKDYHNYSINLGVSGIGATLARAAGGPIFGPGTGVSDSIPVMASNGEHMWTAREVAAAGGHGAVKALRDAVLGGALHRAAGGPVTWNDMFLQAKVGISPSSISAMERSLRSAASGAFAPNAPAAAGGNVALGKLMAARYGWTGGQWNDLYALWQRESGWNNNAQNPTSTAYGIPQFLNSTWAGVGYGKTSDAAVQIAAGLKYIAQRYGSPAGAWAHEMSAGWYDGGGWLPPGASMALNGTGQPERVRTASQEAALQKHLAGQPAVFNLYDADGALIGRMRGEAQAVTDGRLRELHRKVAVR